MKLIELKNIIDRYIESNPRYEEYDVRIEVIRKGAVGGTPTVDIKSIHPGFDWDNHKFIIHTNVPIKEISVEDKRDINIDNIIN